VSSHHDDAAASSADAVFRAENDLDIKLADFHPQQGDGFPIAASEQQTATHNPVSSSAPSNPTPDHPAPQHVSTAPTQATVHSDTTITPDNLSSASHVEDTPLILDVTSLSDAIEAPVSDLQAEVTSTGEPAAPVDQGATTDEPAAQVNYAALPGDGTANPPELSGPMQAFDQAADSSTLSIVGIDLHHTATALG